MGWPLGPDRVTEKTMPVTAAAASIPLPGAIESSGGKIWFVSERTLSAGLRSPRVLVTLEIFVIAPGRFACTIMLAVAFEPFGTKPIAQRTTPATLESEPWLF